MPTTPTVEASLVGDVDTARRIIEAVAAGAPVRRLFMSASEAMQVLDVGVGVFCRWVARGVIPRYVDAGTGTAYYPRPQVEQLAAELRRAPSPAGRTD